MSKKSKKQVNLAEKLYKKIEENLGKGNAYLFDEALYHCAESLATNYWLDFTKGDVFKNIDKVLEPKKKFDLKKAMKKANLSSSIIDAALNFFNGEELPSKTKIKDAEVFENWFFSARPTVIVAHIMTFCKADSDRQFCDNILALLYDRPKSIFKLFGAVSEANVSLDSVNNTAKLLPSKTPDEKKKKKKTGPTSPKANLAIIEVSPKIDPFNVNDDSYSSFFFRCYLRRCFEESFKPSLTKLITELYKSDFDEKDLQKSFVAPIETALRDLFSDLDAHQTEKWRIKLLFQSMFNVAYPRFNQDMDATLHAIGTVVIEYICHCIEYPVFSGIEVVDGVRVRASIAHICTMLRNFAFFQNVFTTGKDRQLYYLWLASPVVAEYINWLNSLIIVGFEKKEICLKVNQSIDVFYENFYPPGNVRELDSVAKHFISKIDVLKTGTSPVDEVLQGFVNRNVDFSSKATGMKFD